MPNDDAKKYFVVDHSAKSNDRRVTNPNRRARREEAERWLQKLEEVMADDSTGPRELRKYWR